MTPRRLRCAPGLQSARFPQTCGLLLPDLRCNTSADRGTTAARDRAGAGTRPVRARAQQKDAASPPISQRPRSRASPMPRRSGVSARFPRPTCSTSEYWSLEQAKLGQAQSAARRPGRRRHRRGRRDRRRDRQGVRRGRRRSRAARYRSRGRGRKAAGASAATALAVPCDVTDAASVQRGVRPGRARIRRRRHRRVERRRGMAGPHRRSRRSDVAQELRAEFLRPPARRAGRREDHARTGHRRMPALQRIEAGGESGTELRSLRAAQGRDDAAGPAIRRRLRRRRHPLQRRQRRPHPLGPAHRRFHQGALARRAACPRRNT